jgi:dihydrofolate reductase
MRKIVAGLFISLDGVVEAPDQWHFPYFNDEMGAAVGGQMESSDAMLLGRNTYEAFAAYWPQQDSSVPPADHMNGVHKYVVSNTLDNAEWGPSTVIKGDVAKELTRLKKKPGKDIGVVGSPTLVMSLLRAGVLDELNLLVHPIVVGHGLRLFSDGETVPLTLVNSQVFKTGVLNLTYVRADQTA